MKLMTKRPMLSSKREGEKGEAARFVVSFSKIMRGVLDENEKKNTERQKEEFEKLKER